MAVTYNGYDLSGQVSLMRYAAIAISTVTVLALACGEPEPKGPQAVDTAVVTAPTPALEASPTPSPEGGPSATESPEPTPASDTSPTPSPEGGPSATESPEPTPTSDASPTPSPEGGPSATESPEPTPTKVGFIAHPVGVPTGPEVCVMTDETPKYARDDRLWKKSDPEVRKLLEMKAKYVDQLFGIPGVISVGVGRVRDGARLTDDLAIILSIDKDRPANQRDSIRQVPGELEGCPVQVIEEGRPQLVGAPTSQHSGLQGSLELVRPKSNAWK